MSKKTCYFKCKYDGQLYSFPPVTYNSYERYCKWKDILGKEDKRKDDHYIANNFKLCNNHFEKYYIAANKRLTKHAVPTLKLGITVQQEELLCTFIEENPKIIMENIKDQSLEWFISNWQTIGPQLNTLGPERNYGDWAEYLSEVMSNLKTKKVIWEKNTNATKEHMVKNTEDFIDLELKILHLWNNGIIAPDSCDHYQSDFKEHEEVEYIIEDGNSDNSRDSETSWTGRDVATNEIFTFTLNVPTGGHKPLLQAADIAPYEDPLNINCKCKSSNNDVQDEFDAFGKDIAQQLRSMPIQTASETQQLLMSVLRSKQSKILNDSFLPY